MDNFDLRKFLTEGKLHEAMSPQDVVDIADTVAEEFTKESADEGDFMVYSVGRMDADDMSFELDTDTTAQTPERILKMSNLGVGEGWGGSFRISPKEEGYEVRNAEKGGLVAIIDNMGNFKMISADEARAEMGRAKGEETDYMERRRETDDYIQEVLGQIKETLDDEAFDMAEKIIDSLGAEKAVGELVRAMSTDDAKLYLGGIIRDYDLKENEIKEKPSTNNKMKKSELKEMIKAAMVFEAEDSKKGNKEEQKRMEGAIRDDRDHIKDLEKDIKDNEEKLAKLKKDFKDDVNEGGKYYEDDMDEEMRKDDMDEAKYYEDDMKEAEEDDVDVDVEKDIDVNIDDEVDIDDESKTSDIDVKTTVPGEDIDVEAVQGLLMKAQEEAGKLGDEKLTDQIGNTITYFTRAHVARVDEMDLDMELDPTDVTKISPEAAAVIGLDEKKEDMDEEMKDEVKENLNESVEAFPLWNRIK